MKEPNFGQGSFLAFWNSLTFAQRTELVHNLEAFHALVGSLKGRGIITTDKNIQVITIIKKDPDVKRLDELFHTINAPGMKLIYATPLTRRRKM